MWWNCDGMVQSDGDFLARLENGDIFASFRAASGWTRRVANQVVSSWESLYFFLETEQDQWWNEQGRW